MIRLSQIQFDTIYARLGVKFDHALGESFYNPWLKTLVDELLANGIARESEGAIGVFSDGSMPPRRPVLSIVRRMDADPALIRKSDGGFNYTTTDLATMALPARNMDAGRNHLRHGRPAAIALSAIVPHLCKMAIRTPIDNSHVPKLAHVWFG